MTFPSRQDGEELQERRACAQVDVGGPRQRNSSFPMLWERLAAVIRAWDARDEDAAREELRQLGDEALRLARSEPLWAARPGRDDTGWAR